MKTIDQAEIKEALRILWDNGLSPPHHPDIIKAAKGVSSIIARLRKDLSDPPADVREHVLKSVGYWSMCRWTEDSDGNWDTGCGQKHTFMEAGPVENHHAYCPYCGKRIEAAR